MAAKRRKIHKDKISGLVISITIQVLHKLYLKARTQMRLSYVSLVCKRKFNIQNSWFDDHMHHLRICGHIHYTTGTPSRLQEYGVYLVGAASSRECRSSTVLPSFIAAESHSHNW